ncbi:MAG: methionine adenosyltransferase domain-containing protein [Parcubacteria group bacterium]|nr:methionine adenosyltransferase domain-containing protein [Parcubacteria group bacterium]
MGSIKTCEFVSPKHPDKICDIIADSLLDAFIAQDPQSRVALEIMGGHGRVTVSGEVTSKAKVDIAPIVHNLMGKKYEIATTISQQSPFIARGVDTGGAGDQGIMVGYATRETESRMPLEYELARRICRAMYQKYPTDGKVQVTLDGNKVLAVVASFQNTKTEEVRTILQDLVKAEEYLVNPAGEWEVGGFDSDSGLSGRKIVVDAYGPEIPVGGGSFSGKDPTKVDRSGAYMARKIAVGLLESAKADTVLVKIAYAIGKAEPLMAKALINGAEEIQIPKEYNLTPKGIIEKLGLRSPIYAKTAAWGHFGRGFSWDLL